MTDYVQTWEKSPKSAYVIYEWPLRNDQER